MKLDISRNIAEFAWQMLIRYLFKVMTKQSLKIYIEIYWAIWA